MNYAQRFTSKKNLMLIKKLHFPKNQNLTEYSVWFRNSGGPKIWGITETETKMTKKVFQTLLKSICQTVGVQRRDTMRLLKYFASNMFLFYGHSCHLTASPQGSDKICFLRISLMIWVEKFINQNRLTISNPTKVSW